MCVHIYIYLCIYIHMYIYIYQTLLTKVCFSDVAPDVYGAYRTHAADDICTLIVMNHQSTSFKYQHRLFTSEVCSKNEWPTRPLAGTQTLKICMIGVGQMRGVLRFIPILFFIKFYEHGFVLSCYFNSHISHSQWMHVMNAPLSSTAA